MFSLKDTPLQLQDPRPPAAERHFVPTRGDAKHPARRVVGYSFSRELDAPAIHPQLHAFFLLCEIGEKSRGRDGISGSPCTGIDTFDERSGLVQKLRGARVESLREESAATSRLHEQNKPRRRVVSSERTFDELAHDSSLDVAEKNGTARVKEKVPAIGEKYRVPMLTLISSRRHGRRPPPAASIRYRRPLGSLA